MRDINKTDLVARLRGYAEDYDVVGDATVANGLREAADAIEALARERDEARTQVSLASDPAYLATVIDKVGMVDAEWKVRAESAAAEISRLRDALKPFAALADIPERLEDNATVQAGIDYTMDAEEVDGLQRLSGGALTSNRATLIVSVDGLKAGDFRRARTALEANHG